MAGDGRHGRGDDAGAARRPPPDSSTNSCSSPSCGRAALAFLDRSWRRVADLAIAVAVGAAVAAPQLLACGRGEARQLARLRQDARASSSRRRCRPSPTASRRSCSARSATSTRPSSPAGSRRSATSASAARSLAVVRHRRSASAIRPAGRWRSRSARSPSSAWCGHSDRAHAVFTVAYDWLPGFDLARASARWLDVTVFGVALGVAWGVDVLADSVRGTSDRRRRVGGCSRSSSARAPRARPRARRGRRSASSPMAGPWRRGWRWRRS